MVPTDVVADVVVVTAPPSLRWNREQLAFLAPTTPLTLRTEGRNPVLRWVSKVRNTQSC